MKTLTESSFKVTWLMNNVAISATTVSISSISFSLRRRAVRA